jgi:hypothetical protein
MNKKNPEQISSGSFNYLLILASVTSEGSRNNVFSQGEVGDNREKWGDFWEKSIAINQNVVSRPL